MPTILTYTTIQGDMFDLIAFKVYGNEKYSILLMTANPDWSDTVVFDAGVVLTCPATATSSSNVSKVPWNTLLQNV